MVKMVVVKSHGLGLEDPPKWSEPREELKSGNTWTQNQEIRGSEPKGS